MKTKYKYIHFEDRVGCWLVVNNRSGDYLGKISYDYPWKQFVFVSDNPNAIFSASCLQDIIHFIGQLKKGETT